MTRANDIVCWIVSQPHAGMRNQCLGLAQALGIEAALVTVDPPGWLRAVPVSWRRPFALRRIAGFDGRFPTDTPPELIIACGRGSIAPALALKRKTGCRVIYIHDPRTLYRRFDLIVLARHDRRRSGANIVVSDGALHRLSGDVLRAAGRSRTGRGLDRLAPPPTALLLGGRSKHGEITIRQIESWLAVIEAMHADRPMTLLLLPSRRTTAATIEALRKRLAEIGVPFRQMEPKKKDNPYPAVLARARRLIVTADSVSMLSEACSLGRPVYIAPAPASGRLRRFHDFLVERGSALPLAGWSPAADRRDFSPLDVMADPRRRAQALIDVIRREKRPSQGHVSPGHLSHDGAPGSVLE